MPITSQDFDLLRQFIQQQCGLVVGEEKTYLIEGRLSQIMLEAGCENFRDFYLKAKDSSNQNLREKIIDSITTHETFWFRDERPWKVINDVLIPEFIQNLKLGKKNKIRIWCAACSSGQEPYSLALSIDNYLSKNPSSIRTESFEILATDISTSTLALAKAGRYNQIEISRGLNQQMREKYFTKEGPVYTLNEDIRKRITFKQLNLQDSFINLGKFDLILCRNVIIYFSEQFKKDLLARFTNILNPPGYFFLGASESLLGYSTAFDVLEHEKALYYKLKGK